jgi:large subunit ribosomal protein L13
MEYTIDATGRTIGRVATEAAKVLIGKHRADYTPHNPPMTKVIIQNADALSISERRKEGRTFARYSGYPGGLRTIKLQEVLDKKGTPEAMRLAIQRMLPNNRLRAIRMKNLTVNK